MIRAILIALLLYSGTSVHAPACAAEPGLMPEQELARIDPAKTLLLIKRIKIATGSGLVVS